MARRAFLLVVLSAAIYEFGALINKHHRIAEWLSIRYAGYWLLSLFFTAACLSSGHALVRRVLGGRVLPVHEHIVVSFVAGLYLFFLGMFAGGLLGAYKGWFFTTLPALLIAAGAGPSWRYASRLARHVRAARRRAAPSPWWVIGAAAFGAFMLALVYLPILTPNNAAFDSRWYHLGIAEHYAAEGAMRRFPEGWFIGAAPHLASFLYTWAFLLPKALTFDRIELAAHLELTIFLFGVLGIPALFRRLTRSLDVGPQAHRVAWVARFLFPGILLYDSSLCLGADHIASAFAAPIYLLLIRAYRDLAPRVCLLLALALTGALLTKYTGALLLVAPALIVIPLRAVWLGVQRARRRGDPLPHPFWAGPVLALAAGVILTAPHWLKNLAWYGDPLYPVLHAKLHPRPWTADSATRFEIGFMQSQLWKPERDWNGLKTTLKALFTFSFLPNDWEKFHGQSPVFGSLFTFCIGLLPFLKRTKRLWGIFLATHLGVFIWFWTNHQDRYLQAILPWMAASTAAVLALAWRHGIAVRLAASALVVLQVIWGMDVYLMPAHIYVSVPVRAVIDLFSRTPGKPGKDRLVFNDPISGVGKTMPRGAKVLLHDWHTHLGLGVPVVNDCPLHQGGISWVRTPTTREVWDRVKGFGVTHIVSRPGQPREPDTLAGEIVFLNFVQRALGTPKNVDGWLVSVVGDKAPPPGSAPDPVLVYTCGKGLKPGLYKLADLVIPHLEKGRRDPRPIKAGSANPSDLAPEAQAIAVEQTCQLAKPLEGTFIKAGQRDPYAIWVRK